MPELDEGNDQQNEFLRRAYALDSTDAAKDLYNQWAGDYDHHLSSMDYGSPQAAIDAFIQYRPNNSSGTDQNTRIVALDAGCGTGLVGECLKTSSATQTDFVLDGIDLTPGMLEIAGRKGIYRQLQPADLNEPMKFDDGVYDVVFCVGTLTKGHVGPKCLREFARVTKSGGLVIATIHSAIWQSHGYLAEVEALESMQVVDILSTAEFGIVKGQVEGGKMVVLKRK